MNTWKLLSSKFSAQLPFWKPCAIPKDMHASIGSLMAYIINHCITSYMRPKYKILIYKEDCSVNDGTNYVPNHVSLTLIAKNIQVKSESQF